MTPDPKERIVGCLLGHALGDAVGARREGGLLARGVWFALGLAQPGVLRYSDDTVMVRGTVRSILACDGVGVDHLAATWARDARWRRGYGPGALKLLRRIRAGHPWRDLGSAHVLPGGSWGNGAAMRAAPLGMFLAGREDLVPTVQLASSVTHGHALGIDGGVVVALATEQALHDTTDADALGAACETAEFRERIARLDALVAARPAPRALARELGNSVRAIESAVTAIAAAWLHFDASFEDLIDYCMAIGGDTDTIAAMAGGLFGARRGASALPDRWLVRLEHRDEIEAHARQFAARCPHTAP